MKQQGAEVVSDSDGDYEDTRSVTPNPRDVGVANGQPIKLRNGISPLTEGKAFHRDQVSDIEPPPVTVMRDGLSPSDDNLQHDSNETSDTDLTPLPRSHHQNWTNRKFESDLSTAPFSSETSDMETSGNERVLTTDGGSATNLSSLKPKPKGSPPTPSSSPSPKGKMLTRQVQSGSSGDEIKRNKLSVKYKPIQKPSPPPKKPSVESQAAYKVPVVAKKPLHATKSSPMGNKQHGGAASPLRSQQSEGGISSNRSKSIKVSIPAKPRPPPVPAKPAVKPEVRPKPPVSSVAVYASPKSVAASIEEGEGSGKMKRMFSESDLSVARAVVRRSPTMGSRKLSGVREDGGRRQSTPPKPLPPPTPVKPPVANRAKRQPMERKTSPVEQVSPVEQGTSNNRQVIQSQLDSSSKTPSSSEGTPGPSPSPTISVYSTPGSLHPSPSISKRLGNGQKPAILPKKASVKSHQRAASDPSRVGRKTDTATDLVSPSTVVSVAIAETTPIAKTTPIEEESGSGASRQTTPATQSSEAQATPTDGTTSPPPPPIPPRSSKAKRKSSHLELVIPVGETGSTRSSPTFDVAGRKRLNAPRRPPPSPPSPVPPPATEAQPTSNEPTDSGSRMSHSSQSEECGPPARRPASMGISSHYDVGVAPWNSDTPPQPYMYATVSKLALSPEKPRSKTPDFLLRDQAPLRMGEADVRKNSDSELEVHSTRKGRIVRRESSRRAPPKPPKYNTPDETTGYVPVNTETMIANQQKYGSSCRSPGSRSSASPLRDDATPPPLPTQPIPKRKSMLKKSASTIVERPRARDPVYDVIPDIPNRKAKRREYEEIDLIEEDLPPGLAETSRETPVELVRTVHEALPHKQTSKQPQGNYAQLPIEDLRENWKTSPLTKRRAAKSFSCKKSQSLMYRRFNSERWNQRRILTLDLAMNRKVREQFMCVGVAYDNCCKRTFQNDDKLSSFRV